EPVRWGAVGAAKALEGEERDDQPGGEGDGDRLGERTTAVRDAAAGGTAMSEAPLARAGGGVDLDTTAEAVLLEGDVGKLSPAQRLEYYRRVCESLHLNPLTRPFEYIRLQGRLTLYARKDATDQLRRLHHVSVQILREEARGDLYVVTARATLPDGRTDEEIGVVSIAGLQGDALANAHMKALCVPLDSEILTRDGFKRYDALSIGEEVLAYDTDTDTCRWTPLLDVTVYDGLPLVRLSSTRGPFSVVCTPDHSWAVQMPAYEPHSGGDGSRNPHNPHNRRGPERRLVEAQRIKEEHQLILAAPERGAPESLLSPTEAAVLGWAVMDGTIKSTFPTGRTPAAKEQHEWYVAAAVSRSIVDRAGFSDKRDLPRIVTRLSPVARRAMLQAFMLAAGGARGTFNQRDRHVLEAFQILCALEGVATGQERLPAGMVRQRMKRSRHVAGGFLHLEPAGEQPAWCPTTRYGTWVMRQDGRVTITGNTKAKRRVTLSICGLGWLDETEVDTVPGAQRLALPEGGEPAPRGPVTPPRRARPAGPVPARAAPRGRPAGGDDPEQRRRDARLERLAELYGEAEELGVSYEPISAQAPLHELDAYGKALRRKIEAAKAVPPDAEEPERQPG
ncbi:MAG TPA: hypothetical protein VHS99_05955, partial [Chloroflexota bacterium]|nr:hypothetical protein [Chloroflexota bacterium]